MKLPVRKANRLKGYDYSQGGVYFLTICSAQRKKLFATIEKQGLYEEPTHLLTAYGKIVQAVIDEIPHRYSAQVVCSAVMPNHVHVVLRLDEEEEERAIHESPLHKRSRLSKIVGYLKMNASKKIRESGYADEVWQRSYHDHIVRNHKDYEMIVEYVCNNPLNWERDCFYE